MDHACGYTPGTYSLWQHILCHAGFTAILGEVENHKGVKQALGLIEALCTQYLVSADWSWPDPGIRGAECSAAKCRAPQSATNVPLPGPQHTSAALP